MTKRTPLLFLNDIKESIIKIQNYTRGFDLEKFEAEQMIFDAVIRNFEIIGEASRNLPVDIPNKYCNIPWSKMIGFRNIIAHQYFGIDPEIIWKIITDSLPSLLKNIGEIIQEIET